VSDEKRPGALVVPIDLDRRSALARLVLGPHEGPGVRTAGIAAAEAVLREAVGTLAGQASRLSARAAARSPVVRADAGWLAAGAGPRIGGPLGARALRRPLAMEALAGLQRGSWATPSDALEAVVAQALEQAQREPSSCPWWARWLGAAAPAARAQAMAVALSWVTTLWTGLAWEALADRVLVVTRSQRWVAEGPMRLELRATVELRVRTDQGDGLVVCSPGCAPRSWVPRLLAPALVGALAAGPGAAGSWVVGWWPETGQTRVAVVDDEGLLRAAQAVGQGLVRLATAPTGSLRREWDSNPRRLTPHGFSRAAHSSALPSLPGAPRRS